MPWVKPPFDTKEFIDGESAAGLLRASDSQGAETDLFIWFARARAARGVALFFSGGPGCGCAQNMLKLGPSKFSGSGLVANNDSDLTALGLHLVFMDVYPSAGFSLPAGESSPSPSPDRQCAELAANAVSQMASEGTMFSKDLPIIFIGYSYGAKIAAMAADVLLETHPELPLRDVVFDAALIDRIGLTHGWTASFLRFYQDDEDICKRLREADLDAMQQQVVQLHSEGNFTGASEHLEKLWSLTAEITGATNQWNLSPSGRAKDLWGFIDMELPKYISERAEQLGMAPGVKFLYFNPDVFVAFDKTCRLEDATCALTRLREKGVRTLVVTAEWDGMATIEAVSHWLGKNFSETWQTVELKTPDVPLSSQEALAKHDFSHAIVSNCMHSVLTNEGPVFARILEAFLNFPKESSAEESEEKKSSPL